MDSVVMPVEVGTFAFVSEYTMSTAYVMESSSANHIPLQVRSETALRQVSWCTPTLVAIAKIDSPARALLRISRTVSEVSLADPFLDPELEVPCKILSAWFSVGVAHLRLPTELLWVSPSP